MIEHERLMAALLAKLNFCEEKIALQELVRGQQFGGGDSAALDTGHGNPLSVDAYDM